MCLVQNMVVRVLKDRSLTRLRRPCFTMVVAVAFICMPIISMCVIFTRCIGWCYKREPKRRVVFFV